ncbi:hypothetical protein FB475_3337 [Kribbella jejuensis]|uniref:Uncharacterized protein n=1 Tax=Kribbella jejuensis TaxID=236068 RepID=A0A542EUZ2_9ACTN|nr:hypothetical protein FB475_3337 [Kribbella jejuensis]
MPLHHDGCMTDTHRHRWRPVSSHQVSEGLVVYQQCACGQWRIACTPPYPVAYPELAVLDPACQ